MDTENEESGFAEQLDSGIPKGVPLTRMYMYHARRVGTCVERFSPATDGLETQSEQQVEAESQAAVQALHQRQQVYSTSTYMVWVYHHMYMYTVYTCTCTHVEW